MAIRLRAMGVAGYERGFTLALRPERVDSPRSRIKPTMFFVNSMSDLFHKGVPDDYLDKVFSTIAETPQHTYQVLTKRADRLASYFSRRRPPKNVWLGVSVEDRRRALSRIPKLQSVPALVRFLSVEPLLADLGELNLCGIHWVIVGGESGPSARRMQECWVDNVFKQCKREKVAFFFKQWGTWGVDGVRRSKKSNGRLFNNCYWNELPPQGLLSR
jgi:protein gp37